MSTFNTVPGERGRGKNDTFRNKIHNSSKGGRDGAPFASARGNAGIASKRWTRSWDAGVVLVPLAGRNEVECIRKKIHVGRYQPKGFNVKYCRVRENVLFRLFGDSALGGRDMRVTLCDTQMSCVVTLRVTLCSVTSTTHWQAIDG
jgi:hypothetical protein